MRSLKARIILSFMRRQPRLNPLPPGGDYAALRREVDALMNKNPIDRGVTFTEDRLGDVDMELTTPKNLMRKDIVFYIHGGGFIQGHCSSTRGYASYLANRTGLRVCTISYRLAPEHPSPAAAEDCMAVYKAMMEKYPDSKFAFVGESAGGALALVTALWAKEENLPLPVCVLVFSPCTTLAEQLPSREKNDATDIMISGEALRAISDLYGGDGDKRCPRTSPLYGDYRGFPPLFVMVEDTEVLLDDAELLVKTAKAAGVQVTYQVSHGMFHAWPVLGKVTPESRAVMEETASFIHKYLEEKSSEPNARGGAV